MYMVIVLSIYFIFFTAYAKKGEKQTRKENSA